MEDHVFHRVYLFEAFRFSKAGMRRGDHTKIFCELLMKRQPEIFSVSRMQVEQGFAFAAFHDLNLAAIEIDYSRVISGRLVPLYFKPVLDFLELVEHKASPRQPITSCCGESARE